MLQATSVIHQLKLIMPMLDYPVITLYHTPWLGLLVARGEAENSLEYITI